MSKLGKEVLVIAHRGASGSEPENTLRAFELAISQGAGMIEMDLQSTLDGRVVVIHDDNLSHRTNLTGSLASFCYDDLAGADAGKGEKIPTLEETLELTRGRIQLYLEIKARNAAARTVELVREFGCQNEVMLASFDLKLMKRLGEEVRDMRIGLILGKWSPYLWLRPSGYRYDVLSVETGGCSRRLINREHRAGKQVYAWTANRDDEFRRLIADGIDGICTDYPDRAKTFLCY